MSSPIDQVIIKLSVLSRLPEHGRLITSSSDKFSIDTSYGVWQSVRRWFYQDSRSAMMHSLSKLVNDVIFLSDTLLDSSHLHSEIQTSEQTAILEQLSRLEECIQNSFQGLVNLQTTYSTDAQISSELENLAKHLEIQLRKIQKRK